MFQHIARLVCQNPKRCLALAFICLAFFAWAGHSVRLNNHFAVLFAIDNESNAYRQFYREAFGADDGVLIGVIKSDSISVKQIDQLRKLSENLEQNPQYTQVISLTNASVVRQLWLEDEQDYAIELGAMFDDEELSDIDNAHFQTSLAHLRSSPITAGRLISEHHSILLVMAQMPVELDRYKRIQAPAEYFQEQIKLHFPESELHFAGIAFTRIGILELMLSDLLMLVPLTSLVLALLTYFLYRSWIMVGISFVSTVFGASATLAVMGLNNDDINQLTITFPVLLMVIVVANGIHFFHRYFLECEKGQSPEQAISLMANHVSRATFLSCFTTAIGFYALLTADMAILRSFGFYLGSGVLLSFVGLVLIIPSSLMLFKPVVRYRFKANDSLSVFDRGIAFLIHARHRSYVLAIAVILLSVSAYTASLASHDYYLKDMLDEDHPQVQAGYLLDSQMGGALPLEISLLAKPDTFMQVESMQKLHRLTQWLKQEGIDRYALSLSSVIANLHQALEGNQSQANEEPTNETQANAVLAESYFPQTQAAYAQLFLLAQGASDNIVAQFMNEDFSHTRIKANIADIGAVKVMALKAKIEAKAAEIFQGSDVKVTVTGELPVAYEGMNKLTSELIQSVLTALVFIVITIVLMFRDWRLALASLFPNILPIVLGMAFYSLSGQGLNPLPGIAFCIAIGIAVDDTVHLFARFNEELAKGKTRERAVFDAVKAVKGALFSSSFILSAGFLLFLFSGFTWNRDLGLLGAFLIIAALVADLLITPAILAMGKNSKASTLHKLPDEAYALAQFESLADVEGEGEKLRQQSELN